MLQVSHHRQLRRRQLLAHAEVQQAAEPEPRLALLDRAARREQRGPMIALAQLLQHRAEAGGTGERGVFELVDVLAQEGAERRQPLHQRHEVELLGAAELRTQGITIDRERGAQQLHLLVQIVVGVDLLRRVDDVRLDRASLQRLLGRILARQLHQPLPGHTGATLRRHRRERHILEVEALAALVRDADRVQHVDVLDPEQRVGGGLVGEAPDVEQPLGRRQRHLGLAVPIEVELHVAAAVHEVQQRRRVRRQRLDAATFLHRQRRHAGHRVGPPCVRTDRAGGGLGRLLRGDTPDQGCEQEQAVHRSLHDISGSALRRVDEYSKVELENYYLGASWHYRALHWFLLALIVVALGWMAPKKKWLWAAGIVMTAIPLSFLVTDIVLRCVIRSRPPIVNLYDTFLFIAAVGVTAAIVAEVVVRRRFIIALAPVFGALLIALARAFEVEDGKDQMAPLQAVLDTNYYLATHVTSINIGYAAGMFASLVGTAWLLMQAFGIRRRDTVFHKSVVRATYGLVAFGLIFAVFGTIYGGVWANDSWGRFWGWDPKENGALLICIAQVSLLHARFCGWVKDLGFCIGAALTGIVVAFSWFHVNLLGIGLHSYGFASSTKTALFTYYGVELGLVAIGTIGVLLRRAGAAAKLAEGVPATE